jgi:hypothetical protein
MTIIIMKRNSRAAVILLSVLALSEMLLLVPVSDAGTPSLAQKTSEAVRTRLALKIGSIKNSNVVDGCGCYFYPPSERGKRFGKYIFMAELNEEDAWMNIGGEDVKLGLFDSSKPKARLRVGDSSYRKYMAGGLRVRADYVVTDICKPDDESCESTGYTATFTVTKNGRRRIVKAEGGCGC